MAAFHSFLLEVSDGAGNQVAHFDVPIEGAAFFINPLFRMLPGVDIAALREPWYRLTVRRVLTGPLNNPEYNPPPLATDPPIVITPDPTDPVRAISVTLLDLDRELYKADYPTVDVFGPLLTYLLLNRIATGRLSAAAGPFRLRVTPQTAGGDVGIFELLPSNAPVEGIFPLPVPRGPGRRTSFQRVVRPIDQVRRHDEFGALHTYKPELGGRNRLIWRPAAYTALTHSQPVSARVEVGGYLVGQVYRQADAPETLLIEIQQVLAAERTSASAALLLFTGDSWSALLSRLAGDLKGLRLLGWWHTHLFPATDSFGLSGLDETLHRQFFSSPWHFAALLNVSHEQGRVLRCYQPDGDGVLSECAFDLAGAGPYTQAGANDA
jgi:hypothetical protein